MNALPIITGDPASFTFDVNPEAGDVLDFSAFTVEVGLILANGRKIAAVTEGAGIVRSTDSFTASFTQAQTTKLESGACLVVQLLMNGEIAVQEKIPLAIERNYLPQ